MKSHTVNIFVNILNIFSVANFSRLLLSEKLFYYSHLSSNRLLYMVYKIIYIKSNN